MLVLFISLSLSKELEGSSCLPMARKLKQTLTSLPYNEAQALYVVDQCGANMSYDCLAKEKQRMMNFPLNSLYEGGSHLFCRKLSEANLEGRSGECNWCISSALLMSKWKSRMDNAKYDAFRSDYCHACGRYGHKPKCNKIRKGMNENTDKSPIEVCNLLKMCGKR